MTTRAHGFSMVELLAVLVISAIVLGIGLPEMRSLIERHQLDAARTDLFGALQLTRSEAIARGHPVMLAPLDSGGTDWAGGWVVFIDRDGDRRAGSGDERLAVRGPVAEGILIDVRLTSTSAPSYIAYNSAGRSCSAASSTTARWGTLTLTQGAHIRRIKINMLGRARSCDPARDGASCGAPGS